MEIMKKQDIKKLGKYLKTPINLNEIDPTTGKPK